MVKKRKHDSEAGEQPPPLPDLCTVVEGPDGPEMETDGTKAVRHSDPDWGSLSLWERVTNNFPFRAAGVSAEWVSNYSPGLFEAEHLVRPPGSQDGTEPTALPLSHVPAPPTA